MKPLRCLGAFAFVVFVAGCESLSDAAGSVREKLAPREEPRTKVYAAEKRATYEAARGAIDRLGFRVLRGGPAQGEIDAVNGIATDDSLRSARQISMKIRLKAALDGGTELRVTLDEIIEADSRGRAGQGTSTPLRDTPHYEVLFRNVQQALDSPKRE